MIDLIGETAHDNGVVDNTWCFSVISEVLDVKRSTVNGVDLAGYSMMELGQFANQFAIISATAYLWN